MKRHLYAYICGYAAPDASWAGSLRVKTLRTGWACHYWSMLTSLNFVHEQPLQGERSRADCREQLASAAHSETRASIVPSTVSVPSRGHTDMRLRERSGRRLRALRTHLLPKCSIDFKAGNVIDFTAGNVSDGNKPQAFTVLQTPGEGCCSRTSRFPSQNRPTSPPDHLQLRLRHLLRWQYFIHDLRKLCSRGLLVHSPNTTVPASPCMSPDFAPASSHDSQSSESTSVRAHRVESGLVESGFHLPSIPIKRAPGTPAAALPETCPHETRHHIINTTWLARSERFGEIRRDSERF